MPVLVLFLLALLLVTIAVGYKLCIVLLFFRARRSRDQPAPAPLAPADNFPTVTVQLPVYNEPAVIADLIDSICSLQYPRDRLTVQVIDDSTDATSGIAQERIAHWQSRGIAIHYLRRGSRQGYKTGALNYALQFTSSDLISVFDAEFRPSPDFLLATVPIFRDEHIAYVQTRWDHANRHESLITRIQSVLLDSQMELEHIVRDAYGLCLHYNGTAGLWRRAVIAEIGGWAHYSRYSSEDMDCAFLAYLRGWKSKYLYHVVCPGEVPRTVHDYMNQQVKWLYAGSNSALALLPRVLKSTLPFHLKLDAFLFLTTRWTLLLLPLLILVWPLALNAAQERGLPFFEPLVVSLCILLTLSTWLYFWPAQRATNVGRLSKLYHSFICQRLGIFRGDPRALRSLFEESTIVHKDISPLELLRFRYLLGWHVSAALDNRTQDIYAPLLAQAERLPLEDWRDTGTLSLLLQMDARARRECQADGLAHYSFFMGETEAQTLGHVKRFIFWRPAPLDAHGGHA